MKWNFVFDAESMQFNSVLLAYNVFWWKFWFRLLVFVDDGRDPWWPCWKELNIGWGSYRSEVCEGETCLTLQSEREGVSEGRETSQLFTHTTTNQNCPHQTQDIGWNQQRTQQGGPRYHLVFQCWHCRR